MKIAPSPSQHLRKLNQPKQHYDYDGITGAWLWFPWWAHVLFALLMWPLFLWLLPQIPFHNVLIREYFASNAHFFAQVMTAFCLLSALLSIVKAYLLRKKSAASPVRNTIPRPSIQKPLAVKPTAIPETAVIDAPLITKNANLKKGRATKKTATTTKPVTKKAAKATVTVSKKPPTTPKKPETKPSVAPKIAPNKTATRKKSSTKSTKTKKQLTLDLEN